LTLQRLKRDANILANEYSALETKSAYESRRSDSRAWNSEYDEKFIDYNSNNKVYPNENQNDHRMLKSPLVNNYLRKHIYYDH
jgi:hypothetical protein